MIPASSNLSLRTCVSGGVELLDLHATVAPRRPASHPPPTLEQHVFVPYDESNMAATLSSPDLAEYCDACCRFVGSRLRNLVESGVDNGLQNRELLSRLFPSGTLPSSTSPKDDDNDLLARFQNSPGDYPALKTLQDVFSVSHDMASFTADVKSIVSNSRTEVAITDKLTGFARSDRIFKVLF